MTEETEMFDELGWCPECQSPPRSDYAHVRYCDQHMPAASGVADHVVDTDSYYISRGEAGGDSNAIVCEFLHRKGRLTHELS